MAISSPEQFYDKKATAASAERSKVQWREFMNRYAIMTLFFAFVGGVMWLAPNPHDQFIARANRAWFGPDGAKLVRGLAYTAMAKTAREVAPDVKLASPWSSHIHGVVGRIQRDYVPGLDIVEVSGRFTSKPDGEIVTRRAIAVGGILQSGGNALVYSGEVRFRSEESSSPALFAVPAPPLTGKQDQ